MTITLFDNCVSKQCREVTWHEVYELIRGEKLRTKTEIYRTFVASDNKKAMKQMKSLSFPALMPCCHCEDGVRQLQHITDYTGYCQTDFDHLTPEEVEQVTRRLREVPEVLLMHRSMSGQGLHVYFRYEGGEYKEAFRQGNEYIARLAGAEYDSALAPAVHLSCPCHDSEAFFNPDAVPFHVQPQVAHLLVRAARHRSTPVAPRGSKTKDRSPEGKVTKAELIVEFLRTRSLRYDILSRKIQIMREEEGLKANDDWLKAKGERLKVNPNLNDGQRLKINDDPNDNPNDNSEDEGHFSAHWVDLTDRMANDLLYECNRALGMNVSKAMFLPMLMSAQIPEVNPLREYILSLPEWDESETDYISEVAAMVRVKADGQRLKANDDWLKAKGKRLKVNDNLDDDPNDNPNDNSDEGSNEGEDEGQDLWARCFRKWLCAMVASWMFDEVVNHQVLVLIGEQGIFKTSWLDALMPPELALYRSKQSGTRYLDKDEQLRATEFGLINLDEIDRMSEAELNAMKSLITTTDVNVRSPYAYGKERRLRVASYVASGNKERFLTDQTGNRRWLPFHVERIESPFLHPLPHQGLYAQAWHLVRSGFNYWFDLNDIHRMASYVEQFEVETNEQQLLPVYFKPCEPGTPGAVLLTVAEISAKLIMYGNIRHPMDIRQLGALLRKMGYIQKRFGEKGQRGYIVQEFSADAINTNRRINA